MLGAIIGDIVGSRFEFANHRSKHFELFTKECFATDDSVLTLAICDALLRSAPSFKNLPAQTVTSMQTIGREYPDSGYGGLFSQWLYSENPAPYESFGNGAAMRVSGCAYAGDSIKAVEKLSAAVTGVTHNHPEGLKGAEATAVAVYLARTGSSKEEIRSVIEKKYYGKYGRTLADLQAAYAWEDGCEGTVPPALVAFFESTDYEDCIRNGISIGGDSDTICAIAGAVAEAFYGIPAAIREEGIRFLDDRLKTILLDFEKVYPPKIV